MIVQGLSWRRFKQASWCCAALAATGAPLWGVAGAEELEGRVIALDPAADAAEARDLPLAEEAEAEADAAAAAEARAIEEPASYWLGIAGGPIEDPVLRTHLQLAADVGIVVQEVVPESPAAKAGLRKHDILLRVGKEPAHDMETLQQQVAASGGKPLALKVIRLGQELDLTVTPEPRPADVEASLPADQQFAGVPDFDVLRRLAPGARLRILGPGMFMGGGAEMPNGVSVQIQRQNNEPAKITVSRGGKSWTVIGDDPESLKKLPADLRPYVAQLMQQNDGGDMGMQWFGMNAMPQIRALPEAFPEWMGEWEGPMAEQAEAARRRAEEARERMERRMEQMEERLQKMQRMMEERRAAPPAAADPSSA